jgi:hypothetical protein
MLLFLFFPFGVSAVEGVSSLLFFAFFVLTPPEGDADPLLLPTGIAFSLSLAATSASLSDDFGLHDFGMVLKRMGNDGKDSGSSAD